ncbi:MAG: hypothetical protein C4329_03630 [Chitinophagaceae bacterium]
MHHILALVTFNIYPAEMGGQKGVALFYNFLKRHFDVTIASSKQKIEDNAIECLYPNKKSFLNLFKVAQLKSLIKQNKIDLIIAEHSYTGWTALLLRTLTGRPFIIHSHNIEALRFKQMNRWWWKGYLAYEKWIHQQANHNFFISEEDRQYALTNFGLQARKCTVVTYGINQIRPQTKNITKQDLGLAENDFVFLFNGTLDYTPNVEAVNVLLTRIDSILKKHLSQFKIVITGRRATAAFINKIKQNTNFIYKGFVANIEDYYTIADLFLNPITNDSGVKTKVIEALSHNCTVISFEGGACGIDKKVTGEKLITVSNNDHHAFAKAIINQMQKEKQQTPQAFFDNYYWANIAAKASQKIEEVLHQHGQHS